MMTSDAVMCTVGHLHFKRIFTFLYIRPIFLFDLNYVKKIPTTAVVGDNLVTFSNFIFQWPIAIRFCNRYNRCYGNNTFPSELVHSMCTLLSFTLSFHLSSTSLHSLNASAFAQPYDYYSAVFFN
ncbi:hypothetical protein CRM22_009525 [Opisthorchis felineus]|uniref:Uncharacterized protein n=1 Tax=Opisthorchis felineus TaxID=147828 RepID=A0A4S2L8L1_OPIFE|nr:hypothetical protein CRM22_009525 [Opisthorchis felineus]